MTYIHEARVSSHGQRIVLNAAETTNEYKM